MQRTAPDGVRAPPCPRPTPASPGDFDGDKVPLVTIHMPMCDLLNVIFAGMCTRPSEPRPRRDVVASKTLAEILKLPGASTSSRDVFPRCMVKHVDNEKEIIRIN